MNLLIGYDKCTTCKKAKAWLDEKGISYESRPIKEQNPTKDELMQWWQQSGLPRQKFVNTSGQLYRQMSLKEKLPTLSDEEFFELLSTDGMLVKRPLLIAENGIAVGFKEEQWQQIFE